MLSMYIKIKEIKIQNHLYFQINAHHVDQIQLKNLTIPLKNLMLLEGVQMKGMDVRKLQ